MATQIRQTRHERHDGVRYKQQTVAGRGRCGAMVVEFALCAPLLFLVFFGLIEFCRFHMIRHGIDTAVYEGARRGIVPGATADGVKEASQTILNAVSAVGGQITVTPSTINRDTEQVTVTISIPMNSNGWIVPRFLKDAVLTRSCTLSREQIEDN